MIRVGLVDADTSHCVAFAQRLNHVGVPQSEWVTGAKVVAAWPGDSEMMPERIPEYEAQMRGYGIEIVGSSEELIDKIDAVMVVTQQGARHLERARPFLERGMPTFIDKPFAATPAQASEIIALSRAHRAPLMGCSALRYDPTIVEALRRQDEWGPILSADVYVPAALHAGNPGMLHYAIHGVEMLFTLLGEGCATVSSLGSEKGEVAVGLWKDGRTGAVRGLRAEKYAFGFAAHYEKGHFAGSVEGAAFYREMLKVVVEMFKTGQEPFDPIIQRDIIAFISAASESQEKNGAGVAI